LSDCFFGLFNPGDEVILFEPAYDSYGPILRRAGVVPVRMRLQPPHWTLPCQSIEAAITPRTRAILINSPMNPIGKVFDREELSFLAGLLERYDLLAICDEVYEHLTFNEDGHIPLMSLPQARNRSLRIGSAGKTFSVTGWKVGYVTGPANLLGPVSRAHQYLTFATPPHLQAAVAYGLRLPDDYFIGLQNELRRRRDLLTDRLRDGGFEVGDCQGTYFLCLGIDNLGRGDDDVDLCRRLVTEAGVAAIPVSAFYGDRDVRTQIRLCFAKPQPLLEEAAERLVAWRKKG
jgi:aspartate/methionine/tyrosine aminotransferase